jgi:DNA-binding NarL/FixJ family response regulator
VSTAGHDLRGAVLLVDGSDIVHIGLRVLLRRQPWVTNVLSARRGDHAVLLAARHEPRVALVDLFVGDEYGIEICEAIRQRSPCVAVLLTSSSSTLTQHAAHVAGASGFIAKDCSASDLLEAIRKAADHEPQFVWSPDATRGSLSSRQQQILNLMANGATNQGIADTLGLAVDTVKHHTTLIYRRLDVRNRAAAVHLAERLGLLTGGPVPSARDPHPFRRPHVQTANRYAALPRDDRRYDSPLNRGDEHGRADAA